MKSKFKILFLFGILLTVSCSKDNKNKVIPEDRILEIKDLSYNGCKPVTKNSDTAEYIELQTVDSNYLHIKHVNATFNCCPEIITQARINKGIIIYNEADTLAGCNCICLFDLNCKIGPIEYSQYTFDLNLGGYKRAEFNFDFGQSTNKIFTINKEK